jgi:hypothetical protein
MDPKQLALAHFEKVVLAGFAVWAGFATTGFLHKPPELAKGDEMQKQLAAIGEFMGKSTVPEATPPPWEHELRAQLDCTTVPSAKPLPPWLLEKRPYFLYYFHVVVNTETPLHFAPTDISGDAATRGRIVVRWTPSNENKYVICNFEVMRKVGDGEWAKVADAGPGTAEYTDTKVEPRHTYRYKVVSIAQVDQDAPTVSKNHLTLAMEEQRKESAEAGPFETARDVFVIPVNINAITEQDTIAGGTAKDANHDGKVDDKDESAYVRVYKWDPDTSTFQKKAFTVAAGAPIGEIASLGRGKRFDFTTGAVLDDVWFESRKNARDGHDETVQWVRIKYPSGVTEQWNDKDKPTELGSE